jgi:BirA family biotin operon repressor/biotin-[acetyl-CoA-carboxylase] ligase
MSRRFGVSRAMIWKTVKELRAEGYIINAGPGKGYVFDDSADVLNGYEAGRGILGSDVIFLKETASTNTCLKEKAANGAAGEGTCVICERQVKGRGRLGREWFAPAFKNISMSVLLRPDITPDMAAGYSLLAGVCVYEALSVLDIGGLRIKWPNDIMAKGKKVCGILTEMASELDKVDHIIIGIGINVYDPGDLMPAELRKTASSLEEAAGAGGIKIKRKDIIRRILDGIETEYIKNKNGLTDEILLRWKKYSDTIGRRITYHSGDMIKTGTVTDIDEKGSLLIRTGEATDKVNSGMIYEME